MRHLSSSVVFSRSGSQGSTAGYLKLASTCLLTATMALSQLPASAQTPLVDAALTETTTVEALSVEEISRQTERLEAAYAIVADDEATTRKMNQLGQLAEAYDALGDRTKALELLAQATTVATELDSTFASHYPKALAEDLAPYYIRIGEIDAAVALLSEALELAPTVEQLPSRGGVIRDVVDTYVLIEDSAVLEQGLSSVLDQFEKLPSLGGSTRYLTWSIAEAYEQLDDPATASKGLVRLTNISLENLGEPSSDDYAGGKIVLRDRGIILGHIARAYAKQGNTEAAIALLEEALQPIREQSYASYLSPAVPRIAAAYGELPYTETVQARLGDIVKFLSRSPSQTSHHQLKSVEALALAYANLGELDTALSLAGSYATRLEATYDDDDPAREIIFLGLASNIAKTAGDLPSQQAILQQVFDMIEEADPEKTIRNEVVRSILILGYEQTLEDAAAKTFFEQFVTATKRSKDYQENPISKLYSLAHLAQQREDDASAQQLLEEATVLLRSNDSLDEEARTSGMVQLLLGYSGMKSEQIKQQGLETLRLLATEILEPEERQKIEESITLVSAGLQRNW